MSPRRSWLLIVLVLSAACASDATPSPSPEATVKAGVFGPWLHDPLEPDDALDASIQRACRTAFATAEVLPGRHPEFVLDAPLVATDARGHAIWHAMFGAPGEDGGLCWNGAVEVDRGVRRGEASLLLSWPADIAEAPAEAGLCVQAAMPHTGDPLWTLPDEVSPPMAWTVAGRAGSEVASVVVEVPELGTVTPTFRDGWFLAWWPTTGDGKYRILGRDADGEEIAAVDYDGVEEGFAAGPCS